MLKLCSEIDLSIYLLRIFVIAQYLLFMKKNFLVFCLALLVSSCVGKNTLDEKLQKNLKPIWGEYFQDHFDETKNIEVIVATNRKAKNSSFGCGENSFLVTTDNVAKFGVCKISVPKNHAVGEIPLAKDSRQSSKDYFKTLESSSLEFKDLTTKIKLSKRMPLVFVHGFNVRFEEAVLRAAQIAYDLKYQGPIILFTWPAGAGDGFLEQSFLNKTYENNLLMAKVSVSIFKKFLSDLSAQDIKVNLMVHSMGHQVVLPALKEISEGEVKKTAINQLILNAPDFAITDFKKMVKNIKKVSDKTTLYCSYNDKAMLASKTFNSNERLGACALFDDIDVINVSAIDDPALGLGHGYYSSRAILGDIKQAMLGIEASNRLFIIKSEINSTEGYLLRK